MPRRIPDYALQFADFNMISSIGAFGFGLSQLLFLAAVIKCIRGGEKAPLKPGKARKAWSGRCRRRRRTTVSRRRRSSSEAAGGMEPALDPKVRTALMLAALALAFFIGGYRPALYGSESAIRQ